MMKLIFLLLAMAITIQTASSAEDWGTYAIIPVSAQSMTLEAVNAGTTEGTIVSINKPVGKAHQKWSIVAKEGGWVVIKPTHDLLLALAVAQGSARQGTLIVLEKYNGKPWQLWSLTKRENGAYSLTPKHAPGMGMDLLGGKQNPGAKVDLWTLLSNDQHLQWFIRPLAGSGVAETKTTGTPEYTPPAIKPEDIRPGTIKQFIFTQSKIFVCVYRPRIRNSSCTGFSKNIFPNA